MAGETTIVIVGNLTRDPEVRQAGNAQVTSFAVAVNERKFNRDTNAWEDGASSFFECSAWRELGANVAQSLRKGMAVIVQGNLKQRSYEKDGATRTAWELEAINVGPTLSKQIAQVQKAQAQQQAGQQQGGYAAAVAGPQPGYAQPPQGYAQPPAHATQYAPTPQGYPAPGGGYQQPMQPPAQQAPQQGGFPDARNYQPPAQGQPAQYGDDTPF